MTNMNNKIINVSFLFGAGAEGVGNYGLPSGAEFLKNTIYNIEDKEEIQNALGKKFNGSYFQNIVYKFNDNNYKYGKSTIGEDSLKLFIKKYIKSLIANNCFDYKKYLSDIYCIFNDKEFDIFLNDFILCNCKKDEIKKEREKIKDDIKNNLKETKVNIEFKEIKDIKDYISDNLVKEFKEAVFFNKSDDLDSEFLKKILVKDEKYDSYGLKNGFSTSGFFDDKFHTIIDPIKYGKNNFWKVFNYYWFCYFCIAKAIVKNNSHDTNIFEPYYFNGKFDYDLILKDIEKFTKILYRYKCENDNSYYSLINKSILDNEYKDKIELIGVSTTNYYDFCKKVYNNPIFLNGKLSLFEFPEELEVIDVLEKKNIKNQVSFDGSKLFFPFIFGQSYVKPIVNQKQISEFNRFSDILNNSDCLVVLGYNLNDDDNHVNAYLHDFAKAGKKLIVVGNDCDRENSIKRKLRIDSGDVVYCLVDYDKDKIEKIINIIFTTIKNEYKNVFLI